MIKGKKERADISWRAGGRTALALLGFLARAPLAAGRVAGPGAAPNRRLSRPAPVAELPLRGGKPDSKRAGPARRDRQPRAAPCHHDAGRLAGLEAASL